MPNPFTALPWSIVFERRFERNEPPEPLAEPTGVHYRNSIEPKNTTGKRWDALVPDLATWEHVPVTGLPDGAAWPIWAAMRAASARIRVDPGARLGEREDFGIGVTVHAARPLQTVPMMEAMIAGVVASFQAGHDARQAGHIADALQRTRPKTHKIGRHELIAAHLDAPALLAGALWAANAAGTWCQTALADKWLVAGEIHVRAAAGPTHQISGRIFRVTAKGASVSHRPRRRPGAVDATPSKPRV